MHILVFSYLPEHMGLENLDNSKTGIYEIMLPQLFIFGYVFRINWMNKRLLGISITNKPLPREDSPKK